MGAPSVRCPECGYFGIKGDATRPRCGACGADWPVWGDYFRRIKAVSAAKKIRKLEETFETAETEDYITSGDLNEDINKLVESVEVRIINDLIMWVPTLDRDGDGEINVDDLVRSLEDIIAGRRSQTGL